MQSVETEGTALAQEHVLVLHLIFEAKADTTWRNLFCSSARSILWSSCPSSASSASSVSCRLQDLPARASAWVKKTKKKKNVVCWWTWKSLINIGTVLAYDWSGKSQDAGPSSHLQTASRPSWPGITWRRPRLWLHKLRLPGSSWFL